MNKLIKILLLINFMIINIWNIFADDLMEEAFKPSVANDFIINMWNNKESVWNEVFRQWTDVNANLTRKCFIDNQEKKINKEETCKKYMIVKQLATERDWKKCIDSEWKKVRVKREYKKDYCETILWWEYKRANVAVRAPLLVRIAKFILRITVALSITMVIYNWIYYIIESAKWWDVKKAKENLIYIWVWLLVALLSVAIINLVSSITLSSFK